MLKFNDKPKFEELKQDLLMMYYVYNFLDDNSNTLETGITDTIRYRMINDTIKYKMKPLLSMMGEDSKDYPSFINSDFKFSNNDWDFYSDLDDGILSLTFVALDEADVAKDINDLNYCIEINIYDRTIRESWSITASPMHRYHGYDWIKYEYKYSCDDDDNIIFNRIDIEHSDF